MAATARATVTIELPIANNWGDDCTLKEVYQQAEDAARQKMVDLTRSSGAVVKGVKVEAVIYASTEVIPR